MILIFTPDVLYPEEPDYKQLMAHLAGLPGIITRIHTFFIAHKCK
jgi:hypothetical protein